MDRPGSRRSIWSQPWLIAFAAAALSACQGLSEQGPWADEGSEPPVASWRVVERVGESRYLSPSMSGWEQVVAGSILPGGSQISTGIGGRLILTQASNQLSAGTSSRFILAGSEPGGRVRQTAGWLRYRIAGAQSGSFGIETPFLDLSVGAAVVDVTVAESETEVAVVSGRVHVKTQDDRRQIDLHAGYVGYAGLEGDPLALRREPGLALESVPATVIPALHPGRPSEATSAPPDPATFRGADQGATDLAPGPARGAANRTGHGNEGADVVPLPAMQRSATITIPAIAGSSMPSDRTRPALVARSADTSSDPAMEVAAPAASVLPASTAKPVAKTITVDGAGPAITLDGAPAALVPEAEQAPEPEILARTAKALRAEQTTATPIPASADQVRQRFDLLTEGLLDGLSPAPPVVPGNRR